MNRLFLWTLPLTCCCMMAFYVHAHERHFHSHGVDASPWAVQLHTFEKHLKTDPDVARTELQNVAKKLFDEHPLAAEWVSLYFRIRKNGTTYTSDIKRVSELEIRMLTSLNPKKYAKQIQHHQETIEHYAALGDRLTPPKEKPTNIQEGASGVLIADPSKETVQHLMSFFQLLPEDPKASRAALDKFAALAYQNHPLKEEWTELFFKHHQAKKAKILESIRVKELQLQMLKDLDAEKHAEAIKSQERVITYQKSLQKMFERQGQPNVEIPVKVSIKGKNEVETQPKE